MAEEAANKSVDKPEAEHLPSNAGANMSNELIALAASMLKSDKQGAVRLVKGTFRFPVGDSLTAFLFEFAAIDQAGADLLYREAVNRYGEAPIAQFLYLSAYPFGLSRIIGPDSSTTAFSPPRGFQSNSSLQRFFLDSLSRRADGALKSESAAGATQGGLSELGQLYIALSGLEHVVGATQPEYVPRIIELKRIINAALSPETRLATAPPNRFPSLSGNDSFETNIDRAERERDIRKRDELLAFAVLEAPPTEALDRVLRAADKVSDSKVSWQLRNYTYFKRSQKAVAGGQMDDARQLAAKVEALDQRAYLLYEIAAKAIKEMGDQTRAREALDEVVSIANKAESTSEKARALLGVVQVYVKFDWIRAFEVARDAVKAVNSLTAADLSEPSFFQQIEGETFQYYAVFIVEGFSLENVFGGLGPKDFNGAFFLAQTLEDRSLRSAAIVAISTQCLKESAGRKPIESLSNRL